MSERLGGRPIRLGELLTAMNDRGVHFALLLIALPFVGPVPLPGVSVPFGFLVAVLGTQLALGRDAHLPGLLLHRELAPGTLDRALRGATRLMQILEVMLRPRLGFVEEHALFNRIGGFLVLVSGLFLMLPFPLPFSNSLPAWTVIFLALGALGRDGLFFFVGVGSFALSVAFFTFVAVGGMLAIERLSVLLPAK